MKKTLEMEAPQGKKSVF